MRTQENLMKIPIFQRTFRPHFMDWVFRPLDRLVVSDDALIGFIFMACVIDYLAGFMCGGKTTNKEYKQFITEYFPTGLYDADDLYDSLRNGLVHMFTIKNHKYSLTHNSPDLHLKLDGEGRVTLNAGNFRDDLKQATLKYFDAVEKQPKLLDNFIKRIDDYGFLYSGVINRL